MMKRFGWVSPLALFALVPPMVEADSVAQVATSKFLADETLEVLDCRVTPDAPPCNTCTAGDEFCVPGMEIVDGGVVSDRSALREGDIISFRITFTPVPNGRIYGGGGYITEYVPPGTEVVGVRLVNSEGDTVAPRRAGPMASGWGSRGDHDWSSLVAGLEEGSISQVYCDTGIFFSTDARTAQTPADTLLDVTNGLLLLEDPTGAGQFNELIGAVSGEFYAHNTWDLHQAYAFGTRMAHNEGRGSTPHRYGSAVAGPDSWYHFEASPGATDIDPVLTDTVGPWQRIAYPGSETCTGDPSTDEGTSLRVGVPTAAGRDVSTAEPLPAGTNAIRYAIGELIVGEEYFAEVSLRVLSVPIHPTLGNVNCAEVFGGDGSFPEVADGGSGKDNPWRYFLPAPTCTNIDVFFGKSVDRPLALEGDTLTYTIRVINLSPDPQLGVVITDVIDTANGAVFVSATGDATVGDPTLAGDILTWPTIPMLLPGEEHEFTVVVEAGDTVTLNQAFYNSDSISNYRAVAFTLTEPVALIHQSKTVAPREVDPGDTVTYTITVQNDGTVDARDGEVHETLPAGWTVVPGSSTMDGGAFADPTATPPLFVWDSVAGPTVGGSTTLAFEVAIPADETPGVFTNTFLTAFDENETVTYDTARLGVGVVFSDAPVIDAPVRAGAAAVSGTSTEDEDASIVLYVNAIERGRATVTGGVWRVSGLPSLFTGQVLTATAQGAGEEVSDLSEPVVVEATSSGMPGSDAGVRADGGALDGARRDGGGVDGGTGDGGGGCGCRVDAPRSEGVFTLLVVMFLFVRTRRS